MFNYTFDKDGVYIGNLSNCGEKYGITQYRFPHCYELAGKEFVISDGKAKHTITFKCKEDAAIDGVDCDYECLKLTPKTYLVRLGFNAAVVDLQQGLITLICGKDYFTGKVEGFDVPEGAGHVDAGDDMVGTNVAWYLGCDRYVWHEYYEAGKVRVRWSPNPDSDMDSPCKALKINYPVFLVDIEDIGPYYSDAPALLERCLFLQDYDHMMTVGIVWAGGETPMMVTGFAKFMDVEETTAKNTVAGAS